MTSVLSSRMGSRNITISLTALLRPETGWYPSEAVPLSLPKMLKLKYLFFDSAAVVRSVDKSTRKVLSRFGAFVRRTAKQSIRKRKKSSAPGTPPSSHTGLLKRFIFFGYDTQKNSVVIGPTRLTENNRGAAPSILEYGGRTTVEANKKKTRVRISARPFMGPAFEKEKPNLPSLWKNAIK